MLKIDEELAHLLLFEDDFEEYKVVERSEWMQMAASSWQNIAVIFTTDNLTFYRLNVSRTGSEYTEYTYAYHLECYEVEKVEKITHEWKKK